MGAFPAVERYQEVLDKVRSACERTGRDPSEVTVVAVSKGMGLDRIAELVSAGHLDLGENRVDELVDKRQALPQVRWHFVGRIQTNKLGRLLPVAHLIHSIDRSKLAEAIEARASDPVEVLLQVNVSGEPTKAGLSPEEAIRVAGAVGEMNRVRLEGLMTMAPMSADAERSRPHFRALAELSKRIASEVPSVNIRQLSMGMSQDYVVAVEEGATLIRVGEAIFGPRASR